MKTSVNVESLIIDLGNITEDDLSRLTKENATDQDIRDMIDRLPLNLSAEGKLIIYNILQFSIQVGKTVVRMGKKILEIGLMLSARYPNATFGLIVAGILTALIALIPLLGPALAGLLGPLIAIFGLAGGFWKDIRESNAKLARDINGAAETFAALKKSQ